MDSQTPALPSLFRLPLEIRQAIFLYLVPRSRLPTVLRSRYLGVSSVSHRPPPVDALLTCRQFYVEISDVYYRRCTFKIDGLLDPANIWPLWQIEEVLCGTELGKATLSKMRKLELNLFWHRLPEGYGITRSALANVGGVYNNCSKTETDKRVERLERAVKVLTGAGELRSVIITWKEIPARKGEESPDWDLKERVLRALQDLRGVRIRPGDIIASNGTESSIYALLKELDQTSSTKEKQSNSAIDGEPPRDYLGLVEKPERALTEPSKDVIGKGSYFP